MKDSVGIGFVLALGVQVAVGLALWMLELWIPFVGIGLAQLLWLGPLWFYLRRRQLPAAAKGVAILSGLTLLVNATCFGLVASDGFMH